MISRCKNCNSECISHDNNVDKMCFICFSSVGFEPVPDNEGSEFSKSWNGLLGKTDEDLKTFCEHLATEDFDEESNQAGA